jgi:inner membrane protein
VFIGHLPAGWLATSWLLRPERVDARTRRRLLAWGLAASVLPDLDLLRFYLVSDRREVHHAFLPHLPLAWVPALAAAALALWAARAGRPAWLALAVAAVNVALHLVLDRWPAASAGSGRSPRPSSWWRTSPRGTTPGC